MHSDGSQPLVLILGFYHIRRRAAIDHWVHFHYLPALRRQGFGRPYLRLLCVDPTDAGAIAHATLRLYKDPALASEDGGARATCCEGAGT